MSTQLNRAQKTILRDMVQDEIIKIESIQNKVIKESYISYLDELNAILETLNEDLRID